MLNPSISEYQLYRWCRGFRRADAEVINRRNRLMRQAGLAGPDSPFSQLAYNLELEILNYEITTFISLLRLDYYFMHRDCHDMDDSDLIFYSETRRIDDFIYRYGDNQEKKLKYARRYPLFLFDNTQANQAYRFALFAAINAAILFDQKKYDIARNDIDFAIKKHNEIKYLVDIDKILESFKNYNGGKAAGKARGQRNKEIKLFETNLENKVVKKIESLGYRALKDRYDVIARNIAKDLDVSNQNLSAKDKTGQFDLSSEAGVTGYINDALINDKSRIAIAYQLQLQKLLAEKKQSETKD